MTDPRHWCELPNAPAPGAVLGHLHTLPDGEPRMGELAPPDSEMKPFRYLLLRSGPTVHAFVNRCTHFGVPLAERQEHLQYIPHASITCNVHYAKYRWSDGACLSGECDGSPLLAIALVVDAEGTIRIGAAPQPGA